MKLNLLSGVIAAFVIACVGIADACATNDQPRLVCTPFTAAPLPAPVQQDDPHAAERFETINKELANGRHQVIFLGDSLTEKWDKSVWQKYFARRDAVNAGVNGDRTEHLLWRIENGNINGPAPAVVVLRSVRLPPIGACQPPSCSQAMPR